MDIDLSKLTAGQRAVITALLDSRMKTPTYKNVAKKLRVSVGTVYQQLKRVRDKHPRVYQAVMVQRKEQLAKRHQTALGNAKKHSRAYFRKKWNYEYMQKHGYYPWEAGLYGKKV